MEKTELRTLSVLFENAPDALLRIVGLVSRRGIALEEIALKPAEEETGMGMGMGMASLRIAARLTEGECGKLKAKLLNIIQVVDVTDERASGE